MNDHARHLHETVCNFTRLGPEKLRFPGGNPAERSRNQIRILGPQPNMRSAGVVPFTVRLMDVPRSEVGSVRVLA